MWLRDPVLGRANKFNPRCTEARLLGFCLKSSLYIVVDFDGGSAWSGRSREPTLTTDGKSCHQEILSQPPIWSQRQPNSHVREGLGGGEVNPAAQRFERHPVDALPPDPNRDPVPRRLYLKQSNFMAHRTSDRCPEPTSESAPSNLPAEAASSSSAATPSTVSEGQVVPMTQRSG